jgi:membrane-associated phospholipid phosphatase
MPRRAQLALAGAGVAAGLLVLTWFAAFHIGFVERADRSILNGFGGLDHGRVGPLAYRIAWLCSPNPYVYLAAVPVLIALVRRRARVAVVITAILLGANLTTQFLKPLLAAPRMGGIVGLAQISPASWPSGHATAAMSLALCMVLASPARVRPAAAALGGVFAVAVSYSFLTLEWHYPSDVFGGFLVALVWTLVGIATVYASDVRWPRPAAAEGGGRLTPRELFGPPVIVLLGALSVAGMVVLARPQAVVSYARVHTAFVVGAAAIGALGLALAMGVMLALRR